MQDKEINENNSSMNQANYEKILLDIKRIQENITELLIRKYELDVLVDQIYVSKRNINKTLPFSEREFQLIRLTIKEKELEIKIVSLESSIENDKSALRQKELSKAYMEKSLAGIQYRY